MVRCIFILFFAIYFSNPRVGAQTPTWISAIATSGTNSCVIRASASGNNGSVYVCGNFNGTVVIGPTTLVSVGLDDFFIAKWDSTTNTFVWAESGGGLGTDFISSIAVNPSGIYITGSFESQAIFFGGLGLSNLGAGIGTTTDLFVVKLVDLGTTSNFVWAKRIGGIGNEFAGALSVSGANIYVTGGFTGFADFEGSLINAAGNYDVFVSKLTDAGSTANINWAVRAGGSGNDYATAISVNGPNIYIAGSFAGTSDFGNSTLTSYGSQDVFAAKLSDLGSSANFNWATQAGSTQVDEATSLAVNGTNVYIAGYTGGTSSFGSIVLAPAGLADSFVAKIFDASSSGNFIWAQQAGGSGDDVATSLAVRGAGVYVAGYFSRTLSLGINSLTSAGNNDAFLARYTDNGASPGLIWAQRAGGTGNDQAYALAVNGTAVFIGGWFAGAAQFGNQTVTASASAQAGFLATLTDAAGLALNMPTEWGQFELYPNPAHGHVVLKLPNGYSAQPTTCTLLNAMGHVMRTQSMKSTVSGMKAEYDLAGFAPGIYFLKLITGERVSVKPFSVE